MRHIVPELVALTLLAGCAETTPYYDSRFGEAVTAVTAQQVLNPDASRNLEPVRGLEGQAAASTMDRYHKTFENPPAPVNVFTIGVGSGGSGSSTPPSGMR